MNDTLQKTILLVEDSEDDVFLIKRAFREAKVDNPVYVVNDGQSAVEYLSGEKEYQDRSRYPLPSLILSDLKLPKQSGLEVIKWIRSHSSTKAIPVVFFSSSQEAADVNQAYYWGANAYLVKPSCCQRRLDIIRAVKFFWIEHNEFPMRYDLHPEIGVV